MVKRLVVALLVLVVLIVSVYAEDEKDKKLTVDDIFPSDRVLDVQITVDPKDWDTIRFQSRNFSEALQESRQYAPVDHPYTYIEASISIDGVKFPQVGIRKKGFIGTSRSTTRPSLKIKLNHVNEKGQIEGLTNLTFNNNLQDVSLVSQFMGYDLFNAAGSPAPRCAYAKLTVNGQNLGVYTHVERIHRPLLKRAFGNDDGVLYESTAVDFHPDWAGGFEHKIGSNGVGRKKIQQLIEVLDRPDENIEAAIGQLVDLDSFYTFWAMEGLVSFWDGYSGNRNNFFFYLNPETDKFHFIPWGADSLFEGFGPFRQGMGDPVSVKIQGLIANRLYQLESGRQRYERTLRKIIERYWDEKALLAETERVEALLKPYLTIGGEMETQQAIMRGVVQKEAKEGERDDGKEGGQFITDWSLLGPFYTLKRHDLDQDFLLKHGGEANIQPSQEQEFHNSRNQVLKWHPISGKKQIINLIEEIGRLDDVTAYAFRQIESDKDQYVELGLGSDDSVKVWINGQVVHQSDQEGRGVMIDQDQFTVKLNSGTNTCLIKVSQGMGDWGFVIRPVDSFPLSEGIMLSGRLILEGENKDDFPPIRLQATMDSDGTIYSRDLGFLVNGEKYQRIVRTAKGTKLRLQQAVARGVVLAEQDMELKSGQEKGVDLIVNTESPLALKILNFGVAQSAYRFFGSLEERRQFIRQRRGEIMAEIANGMPKWETKPADPFVFKLIFGIPIPIANWGELVNVFRLIWFGSILVLIAIFLCCFQLFGRRYSIHWYLQVLKKYIVFSGRARRNEFWMFQIFNTLTFIIFPIISTIFPIIIGWDLDLILIVYGLSMGLYGLGTLIPSLAVSIRRLHDTGRSGWRLLVGLMPLVGWILTLIWYLSDSEARENKYGPNPKVSV